MKQLFKLSMIAALPLFHIMCFADKTAQADAAPSAEQKITKPAEGAYKKLAECLVHARALNFHRISAQDPTTKSEAKYHADDLNKAINPKILLHENGQTYYISNEFLYSESGTYNSFPTTEYEINHLKGVRARQQKYQEGKDKTYITNITNSGFSNIVLNLKDVLAKKGQKYLSKAELNEIQKGICACEKNEIEVDAVKEARTALIASPLVKVVNEFDPENKEPQSIKAADLACSR